MGKYNNKWGSGQAPWKDGKHATGQQDANAYWSYWSGTWRVPNSAQRGQEQEEAKKDVMQQFPAYNQIKIQAGSQSARTAETALDISDAEDCGTQDYVKMLQRLLNGARKTDARMRKLVLEKDTKTAQWEEFQNALRAKFLEQRSLFNKDVKSIEKELRDLEQQRRVNLRQIQEAVAGGGGSGSSGPVNEGPSQEDLAAWDSFVGVGAAAMDATPDDEIIRRALRAAQEPAAFLAGAVPVQVPSAGEAAESQVSHLLGADPFSTPARKGAHAPPHTPVMSKAPAARLPLGGGQQLDGSAAGLRDVAQYGRGSPVMTDPYVTSPLPATSVTMRTSRSPPARRSPAKVDGHRASVKDGARPASVVRVRQEKLQTGDVLHAKRMAACREILQAPSAVECSPQQQGVPVMRILDDDNEGPAAAADTGQYGLTMLE